jgi:hypothetical protein
MVIKSLSHGYATLGAIAALAFIVACMAHEVVGHGGVCLALGGHITLLSSVYSHCSSGGIVTAAAGPLMSLTVGAICWAVLWRASPSLSANWRLFIVFAMAFNLFWGAGYFVSSAVTNDGDWAFVLRDLRLQPNWLWRCLMGALGVYLYYRTLLLIAFYLPSGTPLVFPYLVAGMVSCMAVLFFSGPKLPAMGEAVKEIFGAAVGLLLLAYFRPSRVESPPTVMSVEQSFGWLIVSLLVTLVFFATFGRGFISSGHA